MVLAHVLDWHTYAGDRRVSPWRQPSRESDRPGSADDDHGGKRRNLNRRIALKGGLPGTQLATAEPAVHVKDATDRVQNREQRRVDGQQQGSRTRILEATYDVSDRPQKRSRRTTGASLTSAVDRR